MTTIDKRLTALEAAAGGNGQRPWLILHSHADQPGVYQTQSGATIAAGLLPQLELENRIIVVEYTTAPIVRS